MADGDERFITEICHGGRTIQLRAPASQLLDLSGDTFAALTAWLPETKEADQLEIRARIVSTSATIGIRPIVRWTTEVGHGNAVWREPHPVLPVIAGTPIVEYTLPARGMLWRVGSREFRIRFANGGNTLGGTVATTTIQVSILPVWGGVQQAYPYVGFAGPVVAGFQQPLPMAAREWRVTDEAGLPFAPAVGGLAFVGVAGSLFGVNDLASFADYHPIPHDAVSFLPTIPVYVAFR